MPNVFLPFFPFVNGTIISADEMNADLAALRDGTFSVTGDTINGPVLFSPDNLYDIGEPTDKRPRSVYIGTSLTAPTGTFNDLTANNLTNSLHYTGYDMSLTGAISAPDYYGGTFHGAHEGTFYGSFTGHTVAGDGSALTGVMHPTGAQVVTGTWTFNNSLWIGSPTPFMHWEEADFGVPNERVWRMGCDQGMFYFQSLNDAYATAFDARNIFRVDRAGVEPTFIVDQGVKIEGIYPWLAFRETDAPFAEKDWRFIVDGTVFLLQTVTETPGETTDIFRVERNIPPNTIAHRFTFDCDTVVMPRGNLSTPNTVGMSFVADPDTGFSDRNANNLIECYLGGTARIIFDGSTTDTKLQVRNGTSPNHQITLQAGMSSITTTLTVGNDPDFGPYEGPRIVITRNINATYPAAGSLVMTRLDGGRRSLWIDGADFFRMHTTSPVGNPGSSDMAGTIVGTQSSSAAVKDILGLGIAPDAALAKILETPVRHFRYKQGFVGEEFDGIVTDESPHFGMDQGKSLNTPNAIGYLIQAIKALHLEIAALKGEGVIHA